MANKSKPWPCVKCGKIIASIVYGQLYIRGEDQVSLNTDGPNVVLRCPDCHERKIWYSNDRMSSLLKELAKELSLALVKQSES